MKNIYIVLALVLALIMTVTLTVLVNAKESVNSSYVNTSYVEYVKGGSLDNGIYIQVCCLKGTYYVGPNLRYMSIPVSVEIWDGYLRQFSPNINVTSVVLYQSFIDNVDDWTIYSSSTKLTDSQGRVRFGYQLQRDGRYMINLITARTYYSTSFEMYYSMDVIRLNK